MLWASKHIRGSRVVIKAVDTLCHNHRGILVPQPEDQNYLFSIQSFELIDVSAEELAQAGLWELIELVQEAPKVSSSSLTAEELSDMPWDDVKALARDMNIFIGNTSREKLEKQILSKVGG
jgi:hypothetical protein